MSDLKEKHSIVAHNESWEIEAAAKTVRQYALDDVDQATLLEMLGLE